MEQMLQMAGVSQQKIDIQMDHAKHISSTYETAVDPDVITSMAGFEPGSVSDDIDESYTRTHTRRRTE